MKKINFSKPSTASVGVDYKDLVRAISVDLPDYMVPAIFQQINQFSLNHSGKIDRRALSINDSTQSEFTWLIEEEYSPPTNDMEEVTQEVWEEVFQRSRISIHQDFLTLAGESLIAIRIISRIRALLEIDLPIVLIFDKSTIARMADHIEVLIINLLKEGVS